MAAVGGALLSLMVFSVLYAWERDRAAFEFQRAAENLAVLVERRVETNAEAIRAIGGFFAASQEVTRQEFAAFTEPLLRNNPSIWALAFVRRIPDAERPGFEAEMRDEVREFGIRQLLRPGLLIPAPPREEYFPVVFIEPFETTHFALGFDVSTHPVRFEAALQARDTGELVASRRVQIPHDPEIDSEIESASVLFYPIYRAGAPVETIEQRRRNLIGFVGGAFRIADTVEQGLRSLGDRGVDIYVYETRSDGTEVLLYARPSSAVPESDRVTAGTARQALSIRRDMAVANHAWTLEFVPVTHQYLPSPSWISWSGGLGGLIFTTLLVMYLLHARQHNQKVQRLVDALEEEVEVRRDAQLEAQRNRDFLSAILNTSGALVVVMDPQGRIVRFNPACERITGYALDDVKGRKIWDFLLPAEAVEATREMFQADLHKGLTRHGETYWIGRDGRRHLITWSNSVLHSADGEVEYVVATGIDITDRRDREIAEKSAQMAHVSRLNALGELGTGLAHEINQPLTAIASYAQGTLRRLQSGSVDSTQLAEALQRIVHQALRASQIIRHLRQLVRKEEAEQAPIDINTVVQDLIGLIESTATRKGVTVELDLEPAMPAVWANSVQIEQVLLNLSLNGIDAMVNDADGRKVLSVTTRPFDWRAVEVVVSDTGPGILPDIEPHLFDPFYTQKPDGMGMGLSISWSIIQAHRGRLWVTKNAEGGVSFHFTLPVST